MARSTAAQAQARVDAIFNLLLQGATRHAILQFAARSGWGLSPRQVDTYIQRAREEFLRLAEVDRKEEFGTARAQLAMLFTKAMAKSDLRTARAIRKDMTTLLGLEKEPGGPVDVPIKVIIGIDPEDDYPLPSPGCGGGCRDRE